jgi:hypothetical protein
VSKLEVVSRGTPPTTPVPSFRLLWPDAVVIAMAIGLTVYLTERGTPFHLAAISAASAVSVFVGVVGIPRGILRVARRFHDLRQALAELREDDSPSLEPTGGGRPGCR